MSAGQPAEGSAAQDFNPGFVCKSAIIAFQQNQITVFQSALFQTTSAVVEGNNFVLVVDPTRLPQEVEDIAAHIRKIRAGHQAAIDAMLAGYPFPLEMASFHTGNQKLMRQERP